AEGGGRVGLGTGVATFGEDPGIERLIRRYGYRGTPATLEAVRRQADLAANLSAAAHLIHGSTEGRFTVTYCPGHLSRAEVEGVGFRDGDLAALLDRYPPPQLRAGWDTLPDGEEVFYVSNPGLGLWGTPDRFGETLG